LDLNERGDDLNNAAVDIAKFLNLMGAGRPSVMSWPNGNAMLDSLGNIKVLLHGYRKDILPNHDWSKFPAKDLPLEQQVSSEKTIKPRQYGLNEMFRVIIQSSLEVKKDTRGFLNFRIRVPENSVAKWDSSHMTLMDSPRN
jgi:hypothetical protein